jgi:exoribonuclease R
VYVGVSVYAGCVCVCVCVCMYAGCVYCWCMRGVCIVVGVCVCFLQACLLSHHMTGAHLDVVCVCVCVLWITLKFTHSVMWTLDEEMRVLDTWFGRTLICSCHELHYGLAQALFDGTPFQQLSAADQKRVGDPKEAERLRDEVTLLVKVARVLRAHHLEKGALELASTEIRFELHEPGPTVIPPEEHLGQKRRKKKKQQQQQQQQKQQRTSAKSGPSTTVQSAKKAGKQKGGRGGGTPSKVIAKQELEIMRVVAEYMILANQAVAEQIYTHYSECALLRRHPAPRTEDFRPLIECAAAKGMCDFPALTTPSVSSPAPYQVHAVRDTLTHLQAETP